ncbi:MAG: hypothetical protein PWP07_2492 [Epulopiscium sp.]|nr:hypothetical protein [Candidatus Epulonipiscium sp.]
MILLKEWIKSILQRLQMHLRVGDSFFNEMLYSYDLSNLLISFTSQ